MNKLTIRDLDAAGKRVFVRCDFNDSSTGRQDHGRQPDRGRPADDQGAPGSGRDRDPGQPPRPDGKVQDSMRLRPVAERLSQLLKIPVGHRDALGVGTEDAIKRLSRANAFLWRTCASREEEKNDPNSPRRWPATRMSTSTTPLDRPSRPRSTEGIAITCRRMPALLMEKEIEFLSKLMGEPGTRSPRSSAGASFREDQSCATQTSDKVDILVIAGHGQHFMLARARRRQEPGRRGSRR